MGVWICLTKGMFTGDFEFVLEWTFPIHYLMILWREGVEEAAAADIFFSSGEKAEPFRN